MKVRIAFVFSFVFSVAALAIPHDADARRVVSFSDDQLVIDGIKQPQLFGAEVQYFRMRGGYGPNVPRAKVIALWEKALDRLVEAKMNTVGFYIPWDFHEYAEGKFDFTGEADEDGDGQPDYPSRDLVTFFKMIEQRGITRIHARPGPYINAEWGYLGFGAIPSWFHDKYPNSHMRTHWGWDTRLYDYADPDLLRHTQLWFQAVYDRVLRHHIGAGKPVAFLQIDNETNYQWQSIYTHDYSLRSIERYREFLKRRYGSLEKVNAAHHRVWLDWNQIRPPIKANENLAEDRDWYRFADYSMFEYLTKIRAFWESIGVKEPEVLFTLAESYNAPAGGVLPNYLYRNAPGSTGMMTVNLYPKTFETADRTLMNSPFKADLDVKSADEASDHYLGSKQEWVMGPEIQGGWWKGIHVSEASRQQTYLTVLGHGMKALFIYYFNEGQNWGAEWAQQRIRPLFERLRREWRVESVPTSELSNEFWGELQARSDRLILLGYDVRRLMTIDIEEDKALYFDAPLDAEANPRPHYHHLKMIGERVVAPHAEFLASAKSLTDDVAIVKDSASHVPSPSVGLDSIWASADWSGGLLGLMMNADLNPRVLHGELSSSSAFASAKVLMMVDTGTPSLRTRAMLKSALSHRPTVVAFLNDALVKSLGETVPTAQLMDVKVLGPTALTPLAREELFFYLDASGKLVSAGAPQAIQVRLSGTGPIFTYDMSEANGCAPILYWKNQVVGYSCEIDGAKVVQIGALLFNDFNESGYHLIDDVKERSQFMRALLLDRGVATHLTLSPNLMRTVAFARFGPKQEILWVTVKTGSRFAQSGNLKVRSDSLKKTLGLQDLKKNLIINDLISGREWVVSAESVVKSGFKLELEPEGSTVYTLKKQ